MIYLDHAATTPPHMAALAKYYNVTKENWLNPSSRLYSSESAQIIEGAREYIAGVLDADTETIIFTSGSTEAANTVIAQKWDSIITTLIEHPCVYNAALNSRASVHFVKNDGDGMIDISNLVELIEWCTKHGDRTLVAIMGANNEIGTIQHVAEIADLVSCYKDAYYFCDTTQLWSHEPIDVGNIDFACMSAHKFGGLKGTGFLYAKDPSLLRPLLFGGHQEHDLRAGTENTGGIAAMAEALRITENGKAEAKLAATDIRKRITSRSVYKFNGGDQVVQNIVSMTLPDCDAQQMVAALAMDGIYISAGSACNTGVAEPSRVLRAIGLSDEEALRTIRISFGADADIDALFDKIELYREVLSAT